MWRIVRSAMLWMCWGSMPAPRTRLGLSVSRQAEGAPGAFFTPGPQPVAGIETPPGTAAPEQRNEAAERPARGRPFSSALCVVRCGGGGEDKIEHGPNDPALKNACQGETQKFFRHPPRAREDPIQSACGRCGDRKPGRANEPPNCVEPRKSRPCAEVPYPPFRAAGYANRHGMCEETHPRRRDENPAKAGLCRSRGRRALPPPPTPAPRAPPASAPGSLAAAQAERMFALLVDLPLLFVPAFLQFVGRRLVAVSSASSIAAEVSVRKHGYATTSNSPMIKPVSTSRAPAGSAYIVFHLSGNPASCSSPSSSFTFLLHPQISENSGPSKRRNRDFRNGDPCFYCPAVLLQVVPAVLPGPL